jgi:hypothetical protein
MQVMPLRVSSHAKELLAAGSGALVFFDFRFVACESALCRGFVQEHFPADDSCNVFDAFVDLNVRYGGEQARKGGTVKSDGEDILTPALKWSASIGQLTSSGLWLTTGSNSSVGLGPAKNQEIS